LDGRRGAGIFERYNHAHPSGFALFRHPCQGKEGFATVAALPRVGGTMTIAELCIFLTVALYLLTIVSAKWTGRGYDNANPRDPDFYKDPIRSRALAAHQNGIEAFPFFAA